jgi:hypothetical protein
METGAWKDEKMTNKKREKKGEMLRFEEIGCSLWRAGGLF